MKEVLKHIAYRLEALSLSVAALEAAALSPDYGGRRLTKKQLNELKVSAQERHKKCSPFGSPYPCHSRKPLKLA